MKEIYLSIGSNLGDRLNNILIASQLLNVKVGSEKIRSSIYETEAWGYKNQGDFLNQCLILNTDKTPKETLRDIQIIEEHIGRKREGKWGERLIDIDIIFFGDYVIESKELKIPHPYLHLRRFVLEPLNEINPTFIHPMIKKSVNELLEECTDDLNVGVYIPEISEINFINN